MSYKSFTFSHEITCQCSRSIIGGLRAVDTGAPDLTIFRQHHQDYIAALYNYAITQLRSITVTVTNYGDSHRNETIHKRNYHQNPTAQL